MGFWQGLVESYKKNEETLSELYPLSTTSISNNKSIIIVTINEKSEFIKCEKINKTENEYTYITIPVTEESMSRSGSSIFPHPIFDSYEYVCGNEQKFKKYLNLLKQFAESEFTTKHIKIIFKYISKCTIKKDVEILSPKPKTNVIFNVEIEGETLKTWENKDFFKAWHDYYTNKKEKQIDYISGTEQLRSISHPKKIVNKSGNAKLISDNDNNNFTYRGRFKNSFEAFSIGYESSQMSHQFLRYLVKDRGFYCGSQVILSYTIGDLEKLPESLNDSKSIFSNLPPEYKIETEASKQIETSKKNGENYSEALKKALIGFNAGKALIEHKRTAVVILNAATTGRLSVTFYRELAKDEYLEKIAEWHNNCKWYFKDYISSPSIDKIIEVVFGKSRSSKDESYNKIKKQAREKLVRCIFDGVQLSKDYIDNALKRVSNPLAMTDLKGKFNKNDFETMLATACALIKKFYEEEKYKMALEKDRTDRDYLYGRLLGAADKLESFALFKSGKDKDRITNAIRYMNAFSMRPFKVWADIHDKISIYFQKGGFALKEIQNIMNEFRGKDYENNFPLNPSYLLGYYHERAEIEKLVREAN